MPGANRVVRNNQNVIVKNKTQGERARIGKKGRGKNCSRQQDTHRAGVARQIALPFELRWSVLRLHG